MGGKDMDDKGKDSMDRNMGRQGRKGGTRVRTREGEDMDKWMGRVRRQRE
jgi:hypothetical protein